MSARSERAPGHFRLGVPSNLPAELSMFVGRADDIDRGVRLLGQSRLVTFTGAGGCGKTRLARQVAVAYARRARGERRRPSFGWDSLTPTELEVVRWPRPG